MRGEQGSFGPYDPDGYADLAVLGTPGLGVADPYIEMSLAHARTAQEELRDIPDSVALAQGAQCLTDAVAVLRDAAWRLARSGGKAPPRLEALAVDLLMEAAAFDQTADLIEACLRP